MKEFTIPMALVDFLPVLFFFLGTFRITKDLRHRMNLLTKLLCFGGLFLVTAAGLLKAVYKLLYALSVGDFGWMSRQFFANQTFGFLLLGLGLTITVLKKTKKAELYTVIPVMGLVAVMIVGLGAMDASLCYLASKLKKRKALVFFIISFFLSLGMGYLSSKDFASAAMNWVAQGVNVLGQFLLMCGCVTLHKAGAARYGK